MEETHNLSPESPTGADLGLGVKVALGLAALTLVEYFIAVSIEDPMLWLLPFVVAKGWLILDYFMHFRHFLAEGRH